MAEALNSRSLAKLALDGDVALQRMRRFQVRIGKLDGGGAGGERGGSQGIWEHRAEPELGRVGRTQRFRNLVQAVGGPKIVDQSAQQPGIVHAESAAQNGVVAQPVRYSDAGLEVRARRVNGASFRPGRIGDREVHAERFIPANAQIHRQFRRDPPLVEGIPGQLVNPVIGDRIAEGLRIGGPVLGSGGIAGIVEGEIRRVEIRIRTERIADVVVVIFGGEEVKAELEGVVALHQVASSENSKRVSLGSTRGR